MTVLVITDVDRTAVARLLAGYGLDLRIVPDDQPIPGSYWGDAEAGLVGGTLYARFDTPIHSILHEVAHFVCMSPERRVGLYRDAGGDDPEENAVCYLQLLLAGRLPGVGFARLCRDMDEWGYSFRLGSARRWFEEDADDAREWLERTGILDAYGEVSGQVRG